MSTQKTTKLTQDALKNLSKRRVQIHAGEYPSEILHTFGASGLYGAFKQKGALGLKDALKSVQEISKVCGNTGFCVWAQQSLLWYILNSCNATNAQQELFKALSSGEILGGTGLSNPFKALAGLESIRLIAKRTKGGILLNGTLAFVSNLAFGHYFAVIARLDSSEDCAGKDSVNKDSASKDSAGADSKSALTPDSCIMAIVRCDEDLKLKNIAPFCAYEGSGTYACVFKDYFVSSEWILSDPASAILPKISAGFVALQCGMGLGMSESALEGLEKKCFFPKETLQARLDSLKEQIYALTEVIYSKNALKSVLKLKLKLIALLQELVNANVIQSGASGYFQGAKASKLSNESAFFSIISPSYGHIQKLLES